MNWITNLLGNVGKGMQKTGQNVGLFTKGFIGGYGEGLGIPQLAGRFTRAEGVTGIWADLGRQLGQIQGAKSPAALPASTFSKLYELASMSQPAQEEKKEEQKKKRKRIYESFIIPPEEYYMPEGK